MLYEVITEGKNMLFKKDQMVYDKHFFKTLMAIGLKSMIVITSYSIHYTKLYEFRKSYGNVAE